MSEELDGLRDAVRTLLAKRSGSAAVRAAMTTDAGYDHDLWRQLCEIGVAGLAIPEQYGGSEAGAAAVGVVGEELGRTLTPSPLLSALVASALLGALRDDDASARLLPRIASGEVVALAWSAADGTWSTPAITGADGRLHGRAHYVLDGDTADVVLVVATDDLGMGVYEAVPASGAHTPSMDATRHLATLTFDATQARRLGTGDATAALETARRAAYLALAADSVGAACGAFDLTVAYAKVREQFGRPIGSFQALKHRLADLYVVVESARATAAAAADGAIEPLAAVVAGSDALTTVVAEMIQLHGGIAITWEHDAHLFFKRAHGNARLFGAPAVRMDGLQTLAGVRP